jgi:hypothetical protein
MTPRGVYEVLPVGEVAGDRVRLGEETTLRGENVARILAGSRRALLFACTLGPGPDELLGTTADPLANLALKGVGTCLLDLAARSFLAPLRRVAGGPPGWAATCSYAPGQYRWPLTEQRRLWAVLRPERAGIHLTPAALMVPSLSLSGVVGFGPAEEIDRTGTACDLCPREECFARRTGPGDDPR